MIAKILYFDFYLRIYYIRILKTNNFTYFGGGGE